MLNPGFCCVRTTATPGCSEASVVQSRPFNGSCRTVEPSTTAPVEELAASTAGAASCTSTVAAVAPNGSWRLTTISVPTDTVSPDRTTVEKPGDEAVT